MERAHRLGRYENNKTRPIIVAFRDFFDVEEIIDCASNLKGSNYGVSRDYPKEISKARQSLWWKFKELRDDNPAKKVVMEYPARITVDGTVVFDLFPDWFQVLKGSRVDFTSVPCWNQLKPINKQNNNPVRESHTMVTASISENIPDTRSPEREAPINSNSMDYEENSTPNSPSIFQRPRPPTGVKHAAENPNNNNTVQLLPLKPQPFNEKPTATRGRSTTRKINANQRNRSASARPTSSRVIASNSRQNSPKTCMSAAKGSGTPKQSGASKDNSPMPNNINRGLNSSIPDPLQNDSEHSDIAQ
ncbi:MAG: hypothetical protein N0C90_20955 [Candidatus Thiodiazotropha endolucinida]|nr:hypothetical protein [Candidatus Thiodiazotropha taylori]MCW4263823.1 hypothetical protein [Candidatus Thiodiazotropha endolucinida]